jgi:hypothetical protein
MLMVRKIDWYIQVGLSVILIISLPVLFLHGLGWSFCIPGAWQLISSLANTSGFFQTGMKKEIRMYWILAVIDLIIFFSPFFLKSLFDADGSEVLTYAGAVCGIPVAVYYLRVYNRLIQQLKTTEELTGFVRHYNFK